MLAMEGPAKFGSGDGWDRTGEIIQGPNSALREVQAHAERVPIPGPYEEVAAKHGLPSYTEVALADSLLEEGKHPHPRELLRAHRLDTGLLREESPIELHATPLSETQKEAAAEVERLREEEERRALEEDQKAWAEEDNIDFNAFNEEAAAFDEGENGRLTVKNNPALANMRPGNKFGRLENFVRAVAQSAANHVASEFDLTREASFFFVGNWIGLIGACEAEETVMAWRRNGRHLWRDSMSEACATIKNNVPGSRHRQATNGSTGSG